MCLDSKDKRVPFEDVRDKVLMKGFKDEQLNLVIEQYQGLTAIAKDEKGNILLLENSWFDFDCNFVWKKNDFLIENLICLKCMGLNEIDQFNFQSC